MKLHRLTRDQLAAERIAGRVLARDLRDTQGRIAHRKGERLYALDADKLAALPWEALHLIEIEPGELDEQEAGQRLAAMVAGQGIEAGGFAGGAWPLRARYRGILQVDVEALRRLNSEDAISVYTLFSGQVVDTGEVVARAKIIPLVLPHALLRDAEAVAAGTDVLRVRAFVPLHVEAVVQDTLDEAQLARFRSSLREKLAWFGSSLGEPVHLASNEAGLAATLDGLVREGAQLVVLAGSKAMDPLDPAFRALERLGVALERHGVPAHPGSLLWLARLGDVPIVGMPNCGLFSKATVFDLLLPRILAGEHLGSAELAELGHGGFLTRDMAFRFPPYRPTRARGELPDDE